MSKKDKKQSKKETAEELKSELESKLEEEAIDLEKTDSEENPPPLPQKQDSIEEKPKGSSAMLDQFRPMEGKPALSGTRSSNRPARFSTN